MCRGLPSSPVEDTFTCNELVEACKSYTFNIGLVFRVFKKCQVPVYEEPKFTSLVRTALYKTNYFDTLQYVTLTTNFQYPWKRQFGRINNCESVMVRFTIVLLIRGSITPNIMRKKCLWMLRQPERQRERRRITYGALREHYNALSRITYVYKWLYDKKRSQMSYVIMHYEVYFCFDNKTTRTRGLVRNCREICPYTMIQKRVKFQKNWVNLNIIGDWKRRLSWTNLDQGSVICLTFCDHLLEVRFLKSSI